MSDIELTLKWSSYMLNLPFHGERRVSLILLCLTLAFYAYYAHTIHVENSFDIALFSYFCIAYHVYVILDLHWMKTQLLKNIAENFNSVCYRECNSVGFKYVVLNFLAVLLWIVVIGWTYYAQQSLKYYPMVVYKCHNILNLTLLQYMYLKCVEKRIELVDNAMNSFWYKIKKRWQWCSQRAIVKFLSSHHLIYELIADYNRIFGRHLLIQSILLLHFLLHLVPYLEYFSLYSPLNWTIFFATLVQHMIPIVLLMGCSANVQSAIKRTSATCSHLQEVHLHEENAILEMAALIQQVKAGRAKITACGFFNMDLMSLFMLAKFLTGSVISILQLNDK